MILSKLNNPNNKERLCCRLNVAQNIPFSGQQNAHANLFLHYAPYEFQSISCLGMGDKKFCVTVYHEINYRNNQYYNNIT